MSAFSRGVTRTACTYSATSQPDETTTDTAATMPIHERTTDRTRSDLRTCPPTVRALRTARSRTGSAARTSSRELLAARAPLVAARARDARRAIGAEVVD